MRILQQLQEEFDGEDGIEVKIVFANFKPITNLEDNIRVMTEPCFPPSGAEDIPFGMFDGAYAVKVDNMDVHVLFAEQWAVGTQVAGTPDSVLLSGRGEVIDRYLIFDGFDWFTDGVGEFIRSNIEGKSTRRE